MDLRLAPMFVIVLATTALGTACGVELREGVFACGADSECPAGWSCREPEGRCYRTPGQSGDGGSVDGGSADAGRLDAGRVDGGAGDAGMGDAGMGDAGSVEPDGGPPDEDLDGVPDAVDCGPADPAIGATASRACSRACGPGQETCSDGVWAECDAPTTCDCIENATQMIPCGHCGLQAQRCTGNTWVDEGTCTGAGECAAGSTERESQPCTGGCGTLGTQSRTRACSDSCTWSAWSAFGACESCGAATEVDTQGCGNCGHWTRSRSCDTASCTWGAWSAFGTCESQGECAPDDWETESCLSPVSCGSGHAGVRDRLCNNSCEWGAWSPCDCL